MGHIFSFRSLANPKDAPAQNSSEMAAELALDTIAAYKERRAEAKARELACEPSEPWTPQDQELIDTLETLLKGRHRATVLPLLFEHLPEVIAAGNMGQC